MEVPSVIPIRRFKNPSYRLEHVCGQEHLFIRHGHAHDTHTPRVLSVTSVNTCGGNPCACWQRCLPKTATCFCPPLLAWQVFPWPIKVNLHETTSRGSAAVPLLSAGSGTVVAAALLMAQVGKDVTCVLLVRSLHHPPTYPPIHPLTYPPIHPLTHPPT